MDQAQRAIQTESDEVLYEVADHIAVITLNAPGAYEHDFRADAE